MRAVWAGLVGVVLTIGGAQAGECRLDKAALKVRSQATFSSQVERPDLIGQAFRVERVASRWIGPKVAEITVLVRGGREAFLVRQVSDFSGAPTDFVKSTVATDQAIAAVKWGARSASVERAHFSGQFDGIVSGPLTYLDLAAEHCT